MKVLSPRIHGVIDYISVVALALAPTLFGLQGISAMLAYALAAVHLIMTVLTAFPLGLIRLIPLKLHGLVEIIVGVSLVALPWALAGVLDFGNVGRIFYSGFGGVLIAVWLATDYVAEAHTAQA